MSARYEQTIPLNWTRRPGRPAKPKPTATPVSPRIARITRLMALALKFQEMVDRGEVRDYADIARLGYVTRARLTQIMNLMLLAPEIQEFLLLAGPGCCERDIRRTTAEPLWSLQREIWASLMARRSTVANLLRNNAL